MRLPMRIGRRWSDGEILRLSRDIFRTHCNLVGATGTGKTSAMHTILRALMLDSGKDESAIFIFDPLGNFSNDLLKFLVHPKYCTQRVRERFLYIEPARRNTVLPFNPIEESDSHNRYYTIMRAVDLILRAWAAQNVAEQPRLLQWTYKSFCAAAHAGIPISLCRYLLHPDTKHHNAILERLPAESKNQWLEVLNPRNTQNAGKLLESTRNRLDPFFECDNLKYTFGVWNGRFHARHLIKERRIVLFNLASLGALPGFIGDTIGSLFLNQIFETAAVMATTEGTASMPPTYIAIDEFHRYLSPDMEYALATTRQMNIRLILANQSYAQLAKRDDLALEQMIWQARTRFMFCNYAADADLLADEIAKTMYDGSLIKDVRTTIRQIVTGYRREWLNSYSNGTSSSVGQSLAKSTNESTHLSTTQGLFGYVSSSTGGGSASGFTESGTNSQGVSSSHGVSETLLPNLHTFDEVAGKTYKDFNEQAIEFGQQIRRLKTGEAFLHLPGNDVIEKIAVSYLPIKDSPQLDRAVEEFKCQNFESEQFITVDQAKIEHERSLQKLLVHDLGSIRSIDPPSGGTDTTDSDSSPFVQ